MPTEFTPTAEEIKEDKPLLICTVGLPRSGKTTWARQQGHPIVNIDSIRLAFHGQPFIASAEPFIWNISRIMVKALFLAGHKVVIVDATNITRKRRDEWRSSRWKTVFHYVLTTADVCFQRAAGDTEMVNVIDRMQREFEPLGDDETQFGA